MDIKTIGKIAIVAGVFITTWSVGNKVVESKWFNKLVK